MVAAPPITGAKLELAAASTFSVSLKNRSTSALKVWRQYGTAKSRAAANRGDSGHLANLAGDKGQ
jgi:hypothetical protein